MANGKIRTLNVTELRGLLNALENQGKITPKTEVFLSSDEEGNSILPLICANGTYNVEPSKERIVLFPAHV